MILGLVRGHQNVSFFPMKLLMLTAGFVLFVGSVQAQEDARARFEAGVAAYDAKDYQSALAAFSDAYRIKPHPVVRLNIANCYERLGRHTEAEEQYQSFLEEMPDSPKAAEVKRSIARISKRIGTIQLDVDPPDATVTINGKSVQPNQPHRVNAGRYTIEASAPGYASRSEEVAVPGGSQPEVRLHLEPSGEPDQVDAFTDAEDEPPDETYDLDDKDETFSASDIDGSSGIPAGAWIAGGVAVALAAGALTLGMVAVSAESDFEDEVQRSNDPSLSSDERAQAYQDGVDAADRADSLALVSDLFLIGAAAAATTAVVLLVTHESDDGQRSESFSALPVLTPDGAGAVIRSTF